MPTGFSTLQIHLGHWGPVGIVLRLWILIFHGHFAKTLSETSSLLPAPLTAVTGPWQCLGTPGWAARRSLGAVGFVTAVGRGRDLETALQIVLFQGTPVDTVGSEEVQTSECDDLCSQQLPKPSLFIDSKPTGGGKPSLVRKREVPRWLLCSLAVPLSTSGEAVGSGSPPGPSPEVYQQISGGRMIHLSGVCVGDRAFLVPQLNEHDHSDQTPKITLSTSSFS